MGPDAAPVDASAEAFGPLTRRAPEDPAAIESYVAAIVGSMSLQEKLAAMSGDGPLVRGTRAMSRRYNGQPIVAGAVARTGLPGIRFTDGPRGVVMFHSTAFPSSMARAATFAPSLEERIGDAIGVEARTQGANLFAGVCINLLRHPAWGRAQETYGEDPHLLGEMGAALVRGTQRHVMACIKHFAVNSMENSRLWVDVRINERDLQDIYLPHFRRCIDEGAAAVMTAYNAVNGTPCGHHAHLVDEILRGDWGFDGFVMSDFTWGIRNARAAVAGGMDLEMPFRWRFRRLARLVARGTVPETRIDDSVTRLVRAQVRAARRGEPGRYRPEVVAGPTHRALAREAAARSVVLLRNEPVAAPDGTVAPVLPVRAPTVETVGSARSVGAVGSMAVIGWLAAEENIGDLGSSQVHPPSVVTLLHGLAAAGQRSGIDVRHHDGKDLGGAAALAEACDVAVIVVGSSCRDEGEWIISAGGDRRSLRLADHDEALISGVADANARTAVVLMGGSAFITDPWHDRVPALAMAWYPGMEGGHGVADVIFGDVAPGGRLPCTWPASTTRLPPFRRFTRRITYGPLHGYRLMEAEHQRPAFPFGHGLGYTTIAWDEPQIDDVTTGTDGSRTVAIAVGLTNDTAQPGVEVVLAYVSEVLGSHPAPLLTLRGFSRVDLGARATAVARLTVAVPAGVTQVAIGPSADPASHHVVDLPR